MKQPVVSVIIPVYNAERYLRECLDSISKQSLKNIEIICVDDGSTDESLHILTEYSQIDDRVLVLQQTNQFAGAARNKGLDIAQGKYVYFIDADDYADVDLLKRVVTKAEDTRADIVVFNGYCFDSKTRENIARNYLLYWKLPPNKEVFSWHDLPEQIFEITTPAPWNKLYRKNFVMDTGLRFQSIRNSNDVFFTLAAYAKAERITAVQERLIHYRINHENTTSLVGKDPFCIIDAMLKLHEELLRSGVMPDLEKAWTFRFVYSISNIMNNEKISQETRFKVLEELNSDKIKETRVLDHERDYYKWCQQYEKVKGLLCYALPFFRHLEDQKSDAEMAVLHKSELSFSPKVSVVIPVYNVEPYLSDCLNSILNQTLQEIEIICINDGSSDGSLAILLETARNDTRITAISQSNRGLAAVRNTGVRFSTGKYLYFMDSDDLLENNALQLLYETAEINNAEMVFFNLNVFWDMEANQGREERLKLERYYSRRYDYANCDSGKELLFAMYNNSEYLDSACASMIRKEYFTKKQLWFYEGILHEDNAYTFNAMIHANKVAYLPNVLFHRRMRANSIMTVKKSFPNVYGYFKSYLLMKLMLDDLQLSGGIEIAAEKLVFGRLTSARRYYREIPSMEKWAYFALPISERIMFETLIIDVCDNLVEKERLKAELAEIKKKIDGKISQNKPNVELYSPVKQFNTAVSSHTICENNPIGNVDLLRELKGFEQYQIFHGGNNKKKQSFKGFLKKIIPISNLKSEFETQLILDCIKKQNKFLLKLANSNNATLTKQLDIRLGAVEKRIEVLEDSIRESREGFKEISEFIELSNEKLNKIEDSENQKSQQLSNMETKLELIEQKTANSVRGMIETTQFIKMLNEKLFNSKVIEEEPNQRWDKLEKKLDVIDQKTEDCIRGVSETIWAAIFESISIDSGWLKNKAFFAGRWAVGYPYLYVMYRILNELHPMKVLELGMGQSTKMIAQYASAFPQSRHIIVESDTSWITVFKEDSHLPQNSCVVQLNCEMVEFYGSQVRVFQGFEERFKKEQFNFISVDAPLGGDLKKYARIDVLKMMPDILEKDFVVLLDDCERPMEKNTVVMMEKCLKEHDVSYKKGIYRGKKDCILLCSEKFSYLTTM